MNQCAMCSQQYSSARTTRARSAMFPELSFCYDCCGKNDRHALEVDGDSKRVPLYLVPTKPAIVTNWPGTLTFTVEEIRMSEGRTPNGMPYERVDLWFYVGSQMWYGTNAGDNQLVHARRVTIGMTKEGE